VSCFVESDMSRSLLVSCINSIHSQLPKSRQIRINANEEAYLELMISTLRCEGKAGSLQVQLPAIRPILSALQIRPYSDI
jgi:hypothetical protein